MGGVEAVLGMTPRRIRRRRERGWRMPEGAVYVGRPTVWGNPFFTLEMHPFAGRPMTRDDVISLYRTWITDVMVPSGAVDLADLAGHDLACWCRPEDVCHADVLLELANEEVTA